MQNYTRKDKNGFYFAPEVEGKELLVFTSDESFTDEDFLRADYALAVSGSKAADNIKGSNDVIGRAEAVKQNLFLQKTHEDEEGEYIWLADLMTTEKEIVRQFNIHCTYLLGLARGSKKSIMAKAKKRLKDYGMEHQIGW